jgi:hypothetical protein
MTEAEATRIADRSRMSFNVPAEFKFIGAQCKIIELVGSDRQFNEDLPVPGLVRDVVAWLVTFGDGAAGVEMAVDDKTGTVVRMRRTASGPCHPTQ